MLNFGTFVNDMLWNTTTKPTRFLRFLDETRARANARDFLHESAVRFQEPPGMEFVEAEHRGDDHCTIHDVEVQFVLDDTPIPAVNKLNSPVN